MAEFLGALSDNDREAFRAVGRTRRYAKGEAIFHEGDDPGGVVAVVSGTIKVSLIGAGGREVVLRFSGPGELVGELAALGERPRTANVTAVDQVETIAVRAADFRHLALQHPRISELVFEHVAELLAGADRQRVDFATRDVTARIAGRLVELAESRGEPEQGGVRITLALSQDELAAWSGASREAVARSLHLLRELGWIETRRRAIKVLDVEALRNLVT
jgi:CRP/FNR family cyclic AMP-dependent transcriptional regulator